MGLDKRLHAFRPDLADAQLKGRCEAERFVEGAAAQCRVPVTGVHRSPQADAMQLTQLLLGEELQVFERQNGWAWVQLKQDGYVGYVREDELSAKVVPTTHRVSVPLTHIYPSADLKTQPAIAITMNSALSSSSVSGNYIALNSGGHVFSAHVAGDVATDYVSVAEQFLHTPYLWGGRTVLGIDCSGLVQASLQACGITAPRDSDMQEAGLGTMVNEPLRRGDLVFWKGHVGIMQDRQILLHANGHNMMVVSEPLHIAVERIAAKGSPVTAMKRLQ